MTAPTPTELRATLVTLLAGTTDTKAAKWEPLIGPVEPLSAVLHSPCNWRVDVEAGPAADRKAIEDAVEVLRGEHPHVRVEDIPGA